MVNLSEHRKQTSRFLNYFIVSTLLIVLAVFATVNIGCAKSTPQTSSQTASDSQTSSQTASNSQASSQSSQTASNSQTSSQTTSAVLTYASDIAPILSEKCVSCHNPNGRVASIPLDSYSNVIQFVTPNDPGSSQLIQAIDGGGMSSKTTADQVQLLKKWVEQGAAK